MARWIAIVLFGASTWATAVAAQAPVALSSIAFVFDGGGARINGERVRRAVASGLHRSVLRITDAAADAAPATLTVAFSGTDEWVVEVARGAQHVRRSLRARNASVGALAHFAMTVVRDSEPLADWVTAVDDSIVDPFGGPLRARQRIPVIEELVDPFGTAPAWRYYVPVADPWQ